MPDPDEIAAAAERLQRFGNGEALHEIYAFAVAGTERGLERSAGLMRALMADVKGVAAAYLAEHDPTPLTLDVLRQELGEPDWENDGRARWFGKSRGMDLLWIGDALEFTQVAFLKAKTLGMYHRILSVIREQEG